MQNCKSDLCTVLSSILQIMDIFLYFRTLGKEMGKPHVLGASAEAPWIKFPSDFCLGPLKNESCDTPAGVSAVVYDSNPMVCMVNVLLWNDQRHNSYLIVLLGKSAF